MMSIFPIPYGGGYARLRLFRLLDITGNGQYAAFTQGPDLIRLSL